MAMQAPTGNSAEQRESEALLPSYVTKTPQGVFIDLSQAIPDSALAQFVDRLFANGARFAGLDYACFLALLYDIESLRPSAAAAAKIRLASDIVRFTPQRKALYKGVRTLDAGARAEYVFEPVTVEVVFNEPVYGEAGEDGVAPIAEYVRRVQEQPARLDFDEFVADMWLKGVRYGIDATAVRRAMDEGVFSRMDVAAQLAAVEGSDAEMQTANEGLQRDDSPKVLANGKADLRRFKNRFPHVAQGEPLVKKIHRVLGRPGRKVTGETMEPPLPKDFDLFELAGAGTHVEPGRHEDFIVADLDGFLTLDIASNQVSVTEKIENRGGISVRTTGDLALAVDEFIEYGEVQEGRVVEGKHMTFKADVYGMVSSLNGNIRIESNLSGGSAKSMGGNVTVIGRTSCSVLEAWDGTIRAQFAEGCTIIGRTVYVERAVNCEIVAEEMHLGASEGCGILAKSVRMDSADMRKDQESIVTLVIPDMSVFEQKIVEAGKAAASVAGLIEARVRAMETLKSDAEFAKFHALGENIRQGSIKLTDTQLENWRKLESRFAPRLRQLQELDDEKQALLRQRQAAEAEVERLCRERQASGKGVACEINEVRGDSVVQTAKSSLGMIPWRSLSAAELKSRLHSLSAAEDRLFFAGEGSFSWQFAVPELAAA